MKPIDTDPVFSWPVRVFLEDTDAGGIVYHANYLKFMERARTEWVRSRGIGLRRFLAEGMAYVVSEIALRYLSPARLDDELLITAHLVSHGRAWMQFEQQVIRSGEARLLAKADVKVVCVDMASGKPMAFPAGLKPLFET